MSMGSADQLAAVSLHRSSVARCATSSLPAPHGRSLPSGASRCSMYWHLLRLHELLEQSGYSARIRVLGRVERLGDAWGRTMRSQRFGG